MRRQRSWNVVAPFLLSEIGKPIQLLRTGLWNFRDVGPLLVTPEDIKEFADNFKARVRRQDIPINAEHNKVNGALGFFSDMYTSADNTELWGVPEYNDFGKPQVQEGRFRYASSELFREMEDPETGQVYRNVVAGVALTNYPRIKDMAQLSCSEPLLMLAEDDGPPDPPPAPERNLLMDPKLIKPASEVQLAEMATNLAETKKNFEELRAQFVLAEESHKKTVTELAETQRLLGIEQDTRLLMEFSEGVDRARRELRISPAQATVYLEGAGKMDANVRKFVLEDIKARPVLLNLAEVGSGKSKDGVETSEAKGKSNVKHDRIDLAEVARKITREQKVPYNEAIRLAAIQMREGSQ